MSSRRCATLRGWHAGHTGYQVTQAFPAAVLAGGDPGPHRVLRDLDHPFDLRIDLPDADGDRRVAVPAVHDGTAVEGDHVAVAQYLLRRRDRVHDLLIYAGADRGRIAVVPLERGHRSGGPDGLLGERVEVAGADARRDGLGEPGEGGGDDQAGVAHPGQLLGGLVLDVEGGRTHAIHRTSATRRSPVPS